MNAFKVFTANFKETASITAISVIIVLLLTYSVLGHGGKGHQVSDFTAFRALQEATKLYDRLLSSGRLGDSWETRLMEVKISDRNQRDRKELVVSFRRSEGEPKTVYIFLSEEGKYAGSNFTGK